MLYLKKITSNLIKILIVLLFVFPFIWMLSTSLQTLEESLSYPPTWIPSSLQWINFADALKSGPFLTYARNSVIVTVSIIVLQIIVMLPAAYAFAKHNFAGKKILFIFVILGLMTPFQLVFIPNYLMFSKWGIINTLLPQILPFIASPFGIFLLRQYFMQIPEEILESAKLDNASEFKIISKIMVPMSLPALATIALFSFVSHWNDYFWPLVMTNIDSIRPLPVGVAQLATSEGITNWNIVMAGNVVLVLPIILIYIFFAKYIVRAFAYQGIK